ncbi:MAG: DNA polymerase III subunit delta [Bacteroidales bacterium]|jgi:DNA polymerase-3 subunit delta|nr:DNA polymerase III subunit delta [Bacteroidales bacterium]MDI9593311.1 DNA polymerase III subunit delta [Bacteroidota bacterium]HOF80486.1 DNA polymerase III subunit delta [Bacteroidales bacterium]HOR75844.1 DNA polymerase III subunit delta [Bacteroidales bacterium]HPL11238.1 DNA polymerase III subunit delta [Bacteroidales bacterium]
MSYEQIIGDINRKIFYPIYFLTGEEPHFIDKISKLIETTVLSEDEKEFNQIIVYGRDILPNQIIQMAREYPVFGNYRVIIVREAQDIKQIEKDKLLLAYLEKPVPTTLLVFDYKYKKVDGRTSFVQLLKKNGIFFESKKLYDNQVPKWIEGTIRGMGYQINPQAMMLLSENLGTDLSKIENELKKLVINIDKNTEITPDIVEKNIGISKDFNIFELQKALGERNIYKANQIINFFASNPKDNSVVFVIVMLFNYFKRLLIYHTLKDKSDKNVASKFGINPYFVREIRIASSRYNIAKLRSIISILREYDQKAKGVETAPIEDGELMKEMIYKILH